MAGVPDEPVAAEVEGQVQGQAQLDDAEVAGEVGRADAEHAHQFVAHLLGELLQLRVGQRVQVLWRRDLRQECGHGGLILSSTWSDGQTARQLPPGQSTIALQDERDQFHAAGRRPARGASSARRPRGPARRPVADFPRPPAIRGRSACRVRRPFRTRLPAWLGVSFHVEQIVGDLERQPQTAAIAVQPLQQLARRPGRLPGVGRPALRAAGRRGSAPRSCGRADFPAPASERRRRSRSPAPRPGRPPARRPCPPPRRPGPVRRSRRTPSRRVALGQHLESHGQQRVAGQDGQSASPNFLWQVGKPRRRSSSSMAGRSSWISEYTCTISTLHAAGQGSAARPPTRFGRQQHQQRPEPLAGGQQAVAHRLEQIAGEPFRRLQGRVEAHVDRGSIVAQEVVESRSHRGPNQGGAIPSVTLSA